MLCMLISLDTELTQKVQFPFRKNKKRRVWCALPVCLSCSLFFVLWGREAASQAHMYHLLKLFQLLPISSLSNNLGSYYCCISCVKPVPGRKIFTNPPHKVLHPYLPPESNVCLCLAQVPLLFQLLGYMKNFKSFSNHLNDGTGNISSACFRKDLS